MKAKKQYRFEPDYAVPPGETLQEVMESLDMTQKELAVRTGLTVQSLNRIFKGEQPITYESANRLELALGVPARFWNNIRSNWPSWMKKSALKPTCYG
jgi:HTH-type transcriptional regulator/antitoxin HigA